MRIFNTSTDTESASVGAALAKYIKSSGKNRVFVAIRGDLGAGKTVFTRGFVSVLSKGSRVKSPTYTVVNEYLKGEVPVYHFDFYRLNSSDELDGIGFDDYLDGGICIGEWCEKIEDAVPSDAINVEIKKDGEFNRIITLDVDIFLEE